MSIYPPKMRLTYKKIQIWRENVNFYAPSLKAKF